MYYVMVVTKSDAVEASKELEPPANSFTVALSIILYHLR